MHKDAIRSQFHAALSMMKQAIEECPPDLWNRTDDKNKFWRVAYHALFYTHLYLQPIVQDFVPWSGHIPESENWDLALDPSHDETEMSSVYTKEDLLSYLSFCRQQVDSLMQMHDPGADSGFHWLPMSKLELQIYSIRHLQLHIGELAERLWAVAGIEVDWKSRGS